ncbi:MAG: hypothetical protein GY754_18035 [bacterium]|nr:hypothetical protein [bacterium]
MRKTYGIYALVCIVIFGLGIYLAGGEFSFFMDLPSLMIVMVPTIAMLLAGSRPIEIVTAFKLAMEKSSGSKKEYERSLLIFNSMFAYLVLSTVAAVLLGLTLMLSYPLEPNRFGFGLAVCLLAVLYAVIIMMIIVAPFRMSLKKKLLDEEGV